MGLELPGNLNPGIPGLPEIPGLEGIPNPFNPAVLPPLPFPVPDIQDLPQNVKDVILALAGAAVDPIATGVVASYLAYLENQANGNFTNIPQSLIRLLRPHYSSDLNNVKYAQNINTVHGQAITVEDHIFFTETLDLSRRDHLRWLLHELQHCDQYRAIGGKGPFLAKYVAQSAAKVIQDRSFNVHDDVGFEQEADAKANDIFPLIWELKTSGVSPLACKKGGFYLDADLGNVNSLGCKLTLFPDQGAERLNQSWMRRSAGNGYFWIVCAHSGLVIDAEITRTNNNNCPIQLYSAIPGGDNQLWQFDQLAPGEYRIRCKAGGRCLDADANQTHIPGCNVKLWEWNGGDQQIWQM